ncbi:hypothetical protein NN561_015781 [Cricetulus griseus]
MGLGHVAVHSAGALSTLQSGSFFGLQDASPLKIWMVSPSSLEDTPPCCTPHCAAAGKLGSVGSRVQGRLRAPAESTCCKHLAWLICSHCPRSHPGVLARLQAKTSHDRT